MSNQNVIETNKILIERYFNDIWNNRNLNLLDEIISQDYINHSPSIPNPQPGPKGLKPIIEEMFTGFPDLHYDILDLIITEDKVASRLNVTGTHKQKLWGIEAAGKQFNVSQINIERIKDGKIIEHWRLTDELSFMKQLGVIE